MTTDPKTFDCSGLKPFFAEPDETALPNAAVGLTGSRRQIGRQHKRLLVKLQKTRDCVATIQQLPAADESIHAVLSGTFALFDFLPAILELSGQPADELWIATLGFSKANIAALDELVTAGQIKSLCLVCSTYFAAADKDIYRQLVALCEQHGFREPAPLRTHAKILLVKTGSHHVVVESSANLRSCKNVEQATVFSDPNLYAFHRDWMDELLSKAGA